MTTDIELVRHSLNSFFTSMIDELKRRGLSGEADQARLLETVRKHALELPGIGSPGFLKDDEPDSDEYVVVVDMHVEDGTSVCWYIHEAAAENGYELMSATRQGVMVRTFLHNIPAGLMATATAAHEALKADPYANVRHLATHRRKYLNSSEVELIPKPEEERT